MIGRGMLADPALARRIKGGAAADREELTAWYTALYEGWRSRFHETIAGDELRRKRLLRRAGNLTECMDAVL